MAWSWLTGRAQPEAAIADQVEQTDQPQESTRSSEPTLVRRERTFEQLVQEEIPIQRASLAMQGGPPKCMTLFDEFFSCFCEATAQRRTVAVTV